MLLATAQWEQMASMLLTWDSLPIVVMVGLVSLFSWLSVSEAKKSNRPGTRS